MPPLSLQRNPALNYHYEEGRAWLSSYAPKNTTAITYAAFEFRLAIERIVLQYWSALIPGGIEEMDLQDIRSYKSIEKRIFQVAGHQKKIDSKFEFLRIIFDALKINQPITTPKLGQFSKHWHDCSELCHIAWSLVCGNPEIEERAYKALKEISDFLKVHIDGGAIWGRLEDLPFKELEKEFVEGSATKDDVLNFLKENGIWARVEYNDDRPNQFIGEAIPPANSKESI
jgi:hypothetical protein